MSINLQCFFVVLDSVFVLSQVFVDISQITEKYTFTTFVSDLLCYFNGSFVVLDSVFVLSNILIDISNISLEILARFNISEGVSYVEFPIMFQKVQTFPRKFQKNILRTSLKILEFPSICSFLAGTVWRSNICSEFHEATTKNDPYGMNIFLFKMSRKRSYQYFLTSVFSYIFPPGCKVW